MKALLEQLEPRLLLDGDPRLAPQVIDDGNEGFTSAGGWAPDITAGYDGDLFSTTDPSATAAWTFTGLSPGYRYRIWATWVAGADRATNAGYRLANQLNAETQSVLATVALDQTLAPDDLNDAGTVWEQLGEPYLVRGTVLSIELSAGGTGALIADAIRIERVGAWVAPIGVPTPEFGIEETHWLYADPQYTYDYGNGLEPYRIGPDGPYTHYVDNTHLGATDTGNPYGTPDQPRQTIPLDLSQGSVVEIHGGPYTNAMHIISNGSQDRPVFLRGPAAGDRPLFDYPIKQEYVITARGQYLIMENIDVHNGLLHFPTTYNGGPGVVLYYDLHHAAIRNCEIAGDVVNRGYGAALGVGSKTSTTRIDNVVLYNSHVHHYGDYADTEENDFHGVALGRYAEQFWLVDSYIHHNAGDAIQIDGQTDAVARYAYIGRNLMHENRETGICIKDAYDVIASENTVYGQQPTSSSGGEAIRVDDDGVYQDRVWILSNHIYDSRSAVNPSSAPARPYIIGNLIHDCERAIGRDARSVVNNTIYRVDEAITVHNYDIDVINNIVVDASVFHIRDSGGGGANTVHHNLLWQNGDPVTLIGITNADGVEADPLFGDQASGDFRLRADSPGIDAGVDNGVYDTFFSLYGIDIRKDYQGKTRPEGAAMDLGAFEGMNATALRLVAPFETICIERGSTYRFEWIGGGDSAVVYLWAYGSSGWQVLATVPAAAGGYDWDTSDMSHGPYYFQAQVDDGGASYMAGSPQWVHIVPARESWPEVTFVTPTATSNVAQGQEFDVQWQINAAPEETFNLILWAFSPELVGNTQIDDDGNGWIPIAAGQVTAGEGSFAWDTSGMPAGWYVFRTWTGYENIWIVDQSEYWLEIV